LLPFYPLALSGFISPGLKQPARSTGVPQDDKGRQFAGLEADEPAPMGVSRLMGDEQMPAFVAVDSLASSLLLDHFTLTLSPDPRPASTGFLIEKLKLSW
ncbi:MAG TPA: hypothetical protein VF336_05410, partial [Syntrophales bacterium]